MKKKLTIIPIAGAGLLTLFIIATSVWLYKLNRDITERLRHRRFSPPVEIFSAPEVLQARESLPPHYLEEVFKRLNYRQRDPSQVIFPGDYSILNPTQCQNFVPDPPAGIVSCYVFQSRESRHPHSEDHLQVLAMGPADSVLATYRAQTKAQASSGGEQPAVLELVQSPSVELEPELFAEFYGNQPILRKEITLSQTPQECKDALLAIEDARFLQHGGVSMVGIVRAALKDLASGHIVEGGSTITQQLVKNYFLTPARTFKRKITEMAMSILLEEHESKEAILETYLNVIYMGQSGPFQIRGYGAAAEHYFGEELEDLNLPQCALMAALVNSPGLYNPYTRPKNALERRALVLERMEKLNMISKSDAEKAKQVPLPLRPHHALATPSPYFVDAVQRQLDQLHIDRSQGLKVYTSLNIRAQRAAETSVHEELRKLLKRYPLLRKLKKKGKQLEVAILSADNETGDIQALVGGRSYKQTQFNRALDAERQVGSVMKPFVYLATLEGQTPDNRPYTPLTLISDKKFVYHYQNQVWSPRNFERVYHGNVPLFYALAESLNSATGHLGITIGLDNIIDVAKRVGIQSPLEPLPSISLGVFSLRPIEILQAYTTLARLGSFTPLTVIESVEDLSGHELFQAQHPAKQVTPQEDAAVLVGMMKQTINMGTAQGVLARGFLNPAAGKTGTTSDSRDAWFAGFTPYQTTVVWVGYDDNSPDGLTGSQGAVPIWTDFMKRYASYFPPDDFQWPSDCVVKTLDSATLQALGVDLPPNFTRPVNLVFVRGTEVPDSGLVPTSAAAGTN